MDGSHPMPLFFGACLKKCRYMNIESCTALQTEITPFFGRSGVCCKESKRVTEYCKGGCLKKLEYMRSKF